MPGASDSAPTLRPHPDLRQYYQGDQEKRSFVRGLFDRTAPHYDRTERLMALGTGSWYRRQALIRAGLEGGMQVLDVATGTGLVAREAMAVVGSAASVLGLDPSEGMLAESRRQLSMKVLLARGEQIPLADSSVDFLSMGYALRHLSDLRVTFSEFRRVLRPGGAVCILEITRPDGRVGQFLLKCYIRRIIPWLARLILWRTDVGTLWRYYWETIEACLPAEQVLQALADAGFVDVRRHRELGIFSEYTGRKPSG